MGGVDGSWVVWVVCGWFGWFVGDEGVRVLQLTT